MYGLTETQKPGGEAAVHDLQALGLFFEANVNAVQKKHVWRQRVTTGILAQAERNAADQLAV